MKTKLSSILNQPHPGYQNLRGYFATVAGISITVFLILYIFQPFHIGERNIENSRLLTAFIYAGAASLTMAINAIWIVLFPSWFDDKNWTLGKECIILVYQIISVALVIWLINLYRMQHAAPVEGSFKVSILLVFAIGILPYMIVTFFRHNYLLKSHLAIAQQMNKKLEGAKGASVRNYDLLEVPKIIGPIRVDEFLYAESKGNNLIIYVENDKDATSHSIRSTMNEFEQANKKYAYLFRSHRAFIINIDKIIKMTGNAAGYQVFLHLDLPSVTVARSNVAAFKKLVNLES